MDKNKRNFLFDNARFFLIFLVVFGHFIEIFFIDGKYFHIALLYQYIVIMHIPGLAMISGYFSSPVMTRQAALKLFVNVGIPYVVFETLYRLFIFFIFGSRISLYHPPYSVEHIPFVAPYWLMWYLLALIIWRFMLPFFAKIPCPTVFAVVIGLLSGVVMQSDTYFCIKSVFNFLPFFVAGFELQRHGIDRFLGFPRLVYITAIALCIPAIAAQNFNPFFLMGRVGYRILYPSIALGLNARLLYYFFSFILCIALLKLMPQRRMFFSEMGQRTLYAYLGHGFIIIFLKSGGGFGVTEIPYSQPAIFLLSIITTFAFCSKAFCTSTRYCISPLLILNKKLLSLIKATC